MKKKLFDLKSMVAGITIGALLFGGIVTASTLVYDVYLSPFPVYVNGSAYNPTSPMLNYQGKTYVPLSEFGKLTNTNVSFNNNAVCINSNNYSYDYPDYLHISNRDEIEIEVDEKDTFYINLQKYGARSANISCNNSYVKLSKTYVNYSGNISVEGKKVGKSVIKILYSTGNVDYIDVVISSDKNTDDEIELEVGDTDTIYIDLDDYDANKATLTYDDEYINLSKTKLTSSGKITIKALKEGETTIKIKYNTGDTEYINVIIEDDEDYDNDDEIRLDVGEKDTIYIDLDDYDAEKATLSYDDKYISLSKTKLTNSGKVTVTATKAGETTIKIKYDTGDTDYIDVIIDDDDDTTTSREISFSYNGNLALAVNLDVFGAKSATISYDSSYVSLPKTSLTKSEKITVTPKKKGATELKIKYNTGDTEYIKLRIY